MSSRFAFEIALMAAFLLGLGAERAAAQDDDEEGGGSAVVIQDRELEMGHELTLASGALPLDAFVKGVALTGRYTLHFDDFHAWEIVGVTYSLDIDSGLRAILANDPFGVQPQGQPTLVLVADSSYVAKPLYGKFALFNQVVVYQEIFVMTGFTLARFSDDSYRPGANVGAGVRFFVWDWLSIRFDLRHALVANGVPFVDAKARVDGILQLLAGVSFNVGG